MNKNFYSERQAKAADNQWLWELYKTLLKKCISEQWGWDLEFQKEYFKTRYVSKQFKIVSFDGHDVAAYLVAEEPEHFYLRMLLVTKAYQAKGIGRQLMEQVKEQANAKHKAVKLSVIKANPVLEFYTNLGFKIIGEGDGSIHLEFSS